jgi:hypothetical protein
VEGVGADALSDSNQSLLTTIQSCDTFFDALITGDMADAAVFSQS